MSLVDDDLEIKILIEGFEINEETRNIINNSEAFYGDMLIHAELFNYFAALKTALRLKGAIHMNSTFQFD